MYGTTLKTKLEIRNQIYFCRDVLLRNLSDTRTLCTDMSFPNSTKIQENPSAGMLLTFFLLS